MRKFEFGIPYHGPRAGAIATIVSFIATGFYWGMECVALAAFSAGRQTGNRGQPPQNDSDPSFK
jgi:hypothetical protein